MKKILLFAVALGFSISLINAQNSSDSCILADGSTAITVSGTFTVSTIDGTDIPDPVCADNGTAQVENGEWYRLISPVTDNINITTDLSQNNGADTRIHIYSGSCGALTCVTGDDDSGSGFTSVVDFTATAGQVYYIAWDDRWTNGGFDFQITVGTPPPPAAPSNFTTQSVTANGSDRAVVDMNNDKLDDLVSIQDDDNNDIYEIQINYQLPGGGFNKVDHTTTKPINEPSWSLAAGDVDGNGYNDLVYGGGSGVTFAMANSGGNGYTIKQSVNPNNTGAGTTYNPYVFSQRSNMIDIDNDGELDVFVCHDVDPNVYFLNDGSGDLRFYQGTNGPITSGLGLHADGGNYGTVWIDYDNDRDMDMFIAKCRGGSGNTNKINELWSNNGNNTFTNVASGAGLADAVQTWSSAWGDYDNDGDMDGYIGASSNSDGVHRLMLNNGDGTFTDIAAAAGVVSAPYGIENAPADFNNDGYVDILSNGDILFNDGNGAGVAPTFTVYSSGMPPSGPIGDVNDDGFLDVFNGSLRINNGNANHWLKVTTTGVQSNRNGIGARVEINSPGLGTQIRDVRSGEGFRYMSSLNTHFGLGADTSVNSVTIYWPSGVVDIILNPAIDDTLNVIEGETLSLEQSLTTDLILYPNPTKALLNLNATYGFENAIYSVFDMNGRRVLNSRFSSNTIDVSKLSAGNYILRIIDDGLIKSQKFIKQ